MKAPIEIALDIRHLSKKYHLHKDAQRDFYALKDVSLTINKGDVVGIIGNNGSGKSTLLKLLSGVTKPSEGEAWFYGSVNSILEVGTNFHPDLTGRENVTLHLKLARVPKSEYAAVEKKVHDFSEIGDFFDQPVKYYSSGMFLRLAFSMAFHSSADILLLDEVLSVGDEGFRLKCQELLKQIRDEGKTILFVSHNRQEILDLSTRCLWLHKGEVFKQGNPATILSEYFSKHRDNWDQKKLVIDTAHQHESNGTVDIEWTEADAPGNDIISIRALSVSPGNGGHQLYNTSPVEIKFLIHKKKAGIHIGAFFFLQDVFYQPVLLGHFLNNSSHFDFSSELKDQTGLFEIKCTLPANFLAPGKYFLFPRFGMEEKQWSETSEEVFRFSEELHFTLQPGPGFTDYVGDISKGSVRPPLQWELKEKS